MSWIVKLGKKGKKIVKKIITPAEKHYVGYTPVSYTHLRAHET